VRRAYWIAIALLVVASLVAEAFAEWRYWWERIPGFYALLGFVGFIVLVFFAKGLGQLLVLKEEGYYERLEEEGDGDRG
jgi:hypothetical protein